MRGIRSKEVDMTINFYRPYNVEKRLNKSYVNFKVISQYFMDRVMEEFIIKEHKEAININRKFDLIGGL